MLLSKVIGAILIDLSAAQDAANEYSRKLSLKYRRQGEEQNLLSNFQVPNGLLQEIELDLKFTINELKTEVEHPRSGDVTEIFNLFSREAGQRAINLLVDFIDQSKSFAEDPTKWDKVAGNIKSRNFTGYLTDKVTITLLQNRHRLIQKDGSLNQEEITKTVLQGLDQYLLNHPDLKDILGSNTSAGTVIRNNYDQMMEALSGELEDLVDVSSTNIFPGVDILVSSEHLKDLPVEIISSLKIKAEVINYQWTITDTSASLNPVVHN